MYLGNITILVPQVNTSARSVPSGDAAGLTVDIFAIKSQFCLCCLNEFCESGLIAYGEVSKHFSVDVNIGKL